MNTEFITKPTKRTKSIAVGAYRGLTASAIVFLYAMFPSKEWVKAINAKVQCQQAEIQQLKIDLAVEQATSLHLKNP